MNRLFDNIKPRDGAESTLPRLPHPSLQWILPVFNA